MNLDSTTLEEYVLTANNPEYNGDYSIINSKFPEFKDVDTNLLKEYVLTANNEEYAGDYSIINSKFPEFFDSEQSDVVEETTVQETEVEEKEPVKPKTEEITEEDWKSTEEDFIKNNSEKLARLYPDFEFDESTFDFNGVTVKNKITGEEESFDLNTNYAGFSDFNEFKDFVGKKPKLDPVKQEVYDKTGLTVDYDDYGDTSTNNLYSEIEIVEQEGRSAPFLPEELGVTYGEKTRNPEASEMLNIINSVEGIAIDAATNLKKVFPGIRTENESLAGDFKKLNDKEQKQFETYVYNQVKQQTGLNITEDSFLAIYDSGKMQGFIDNRSESIAKERIHSDTVKYLGRSEASQEYTNLKIKELKNNLTDKQLNLKELNSKISKINDQVELLELKKDKSADDNQRIINFKKEKEELVLKQKDLGGGAWDDTGNWVNTLNVTKKKKEELKQIEKNAYNTGSILDAFAGQGTDIEKLSARDLSKNLLDNRILETEFLDARGRNDSISVDFKSLGLRKPLEVNKITNYLKAKGLSVETKYDDVDGLPVMIYSDSGKEVESIDLTYNDLYNLGVRSEEAGGYKGGLDDVLARKKGEDILNYRIWEEEKLETEAEIRGLYRLVELGENPALIEKPTDAYSKDKYRDGIPLNGVASDIFGFGQTALFQALPEAALMQWGGYNQEEIEKTLGQSPRNLLDQIKQTVSIVNNSESVKSGKAEPIKLTKAQEENFEMGLSEMTATATGGFVPTLLEFAAFELATGGMGTGAAIARMPKLGKFLAGAFKEEVKMQSTTADFGLGTGALFFGLGKVFEPIRFFKKHKVGLNTLMNKYAKAGPAGALSIEGSEIIHNIVDDMLDNSDFNAGMDELYGDTDEATKRFLSNVMMFKLTGAQHFKGRDFLSNHGLGREMNKLNSRSRDLSKQGQRLLVENGINIIPDNRLTPDGKRIPTTSSDKNFKIQEQLSKLSKQKTAEGKKALEILNKLSKVSETMGTVDQMLSIRTQHQSLNPFVTDPNTGEKIVNKETGEFELNSSFEKNFNNQITKPIFKSLSESAPKGKNGESTFVNPEVLFLKAEDAKMQMQEGNTAEFLPEQNKVLVDLSKYTPGKPLHELSHVIFNAYFKKNPQAKINFTNKMREMFKGVDFGTFKDTELRRAIQENYKDKNVQGEEYIAFLTEFLTDPKVYYQNKYTSGTFVNGIKSEIRLIQKQYGLADFAPPRTAADLVRTLGDLGREFQKGYVSDITASQFAALGKIDLSDVEYYPANIDAKAKKAEVMASKDLTKEVEGVEKENKTKVLENAPADYKDIISEVKDENGKVISTSKVKAEQVETMVNKVANRAWSKLGSKISKDKLASSPLKDRQTWLATAKTDLKLIAEKWDHTKAEFDRYMANTGMQRMQGFSSKNKVPGQDAPQTKRIGEKMGGEEGKEFDIKSEDATPEDALIASEESSSTGREGITVSKKLGSKADKVVAEIKRKIPVEKELQDKFLEDKTYKSLKDLAAKETQEMFGIKPKTGNLTKPDVKNAQIFINNNPDLFYGLLPKQHTTKRVNVGTKREPRYVTRPDKATGVQDVLLNAFYNKGTRKDNLTPWTKKPARDVKTSEFLELFGITERGNPNLYVKNSNVSSRIKALVEQTGRIITNQTVREVLPEARLVGEGRSKTMASKNLILENGKIKKNLEKIAEKPIGNFAISAKKILKDAGIERLKFITEEGKPVEETNRVMKNFIENILPKYLPIRKIMSASALSNNGERGTNSPMQTKTRDKSVKSGIGKESHNLSKEQIDAVNKMAQGNEKYWSKVIKESSVEYFKSKEFKKELEDNYDGFDLMIDSLDKMVKAEKYNPEVIQAMEAFFRMSSESSSHPLRMASMASGYEINWKSSKGPEREHVMPANQLGEIAFRTILDPNASTKILKKLVRDNYFQILINKFNDGKIGAAGYKAKMPEGYWESWQEAIKTGDVKKAWSVWSRYFNEKVNSEGAIINGKETFGMNPNEIMVVNRNGILESLADQLMIGSKEFGKDILNPEIIAKQQELISKWSTRQEGFLKLEQLREKLAIELDMLNAKRDATLKSMEVISEIKDPIFNMPEKMTNKILVDKAKVFDKAIRASKNLDKTIKKARVFDFDDTVARTNSKVFAERDGKRKVLTAEEFASQGMDLVEQGWKMDFTDFNKVVEGKKGPLFELMKKMKESSGDRDMFILTARAKESAPAIKEFLDAMGINIPLENITGLGNSTGKAKADWLVGKASEGYNDFYFADDAPQNVKAVKEGMSRLDVKSKTQLVKASKDLKIDSERDKKKLSWKTDEAGNIKTTFEIAGKKYNFNLDARDSKGSFDVEFNLGGRIDMTGTGNAVKVIRTVYNGLLDVVSKNPKIKRLEFSSLKSETSRVKLYTALMDKVAKKLGWETDVWEVNDFIGENNSYDFEISKPRKKQVGSVEKVLDIVDVKSETQKTLASKDLSGDFNKIIEESTGIGAEKVFSDVKAEIRGNKARRQKFFIPPSAEDFTGLLYRTLGKGKKGEAHMKFYQENLLDPYARAMENLSTDRVNLMADFKALKKELNVPKDLRKTTESGFTNEQAVRSYLWGKEGKEIPGLSKADMKELSDLVENNPKLKAFADQIMSITKGDGYSTPTKNWATGTITTDLIDVLNTTKRAKYLETWNQNKDIIFSKDNLNKLEAAYGVKYRESMENILKRMKSGRNRIEGGNVLSNKVLDYINNSTGAIMFFNTRSAVLQTISAANFVNWGFNNPFRAGKAFANQPQYWKDFVKLINSDYLKDRRNGLKLNISESEIADAAKTSTNKAKAGINYILEKGYLPTKFADSFAIAAGGATFYRNRINDLIKNEGLTKSEAEIRAMKEFREVSEISQQSSDPSKISSQQASTLGRVVLQFANTPMQYARIQKRAVQDIVNGRGDLKTNISKIAYYGFLQNMLFNSLQQGLFALGFGDDEIDEKEEQKIIKMANGMVDSSLRGLGFAGVTVQVLKNLGIDLYDRSKRDRPEYSDSYIKLLEFSPAIKSKLSKFRGAAYPFDSKKRRAEVFEKGFSLDNPAYESMAKVVTATTNVPLDRLYSKVNNLSAAMDDETETWQSIAMFLGWPEWQIKGKQNYVEAPKTEEEKIKNKEEKSKTRLKAAKGSTDFETLKKLNKSEQLRLLKNLGVGTRNMKKYKKLKEADLINEIINRNKEQ